MAESLSFFTEEASTRAQSAATRTTMSLLNTRDQMAVTLPPNMWAFRRYVELAMLSPSM